MRYMLAALATLLMVGASGCGLVGKAVKSTAERATEKAIEKATGVPVSVDANQKSLSFKGQGGEQYTVSVPEAGKVPDGFPIPLMKGGTIAGAAKINTAEQNGWTAQLQFEAGHGAVADYYEKVMRERGFKVDRVAVEAEGKPTVNLVVESGTEGGLLSISLADGTPTTMILGWMYK
jgi:hypothetical protein